MQNKKMMWVWVLIVIVVIGGLVYIIINNKVSAPTVPSEEIEQVGQTEQNTNMGNTIQPEVKSDAGSKGVEGVKITILKEGTGAVAKVGDTVAMNYTGKLLNGTTFDSNVDPKFTHVKPFPFTIGAGEVIKGWDIGVAGMKVGEKRKLELAPEFAYGSNAVGGVIPANSTLVFEVELLAIK
ncbi:MAG: FKBP-type peptidyl-prolyl cis-trans isomerase [bacterium]